MWRLIRLFVAVPICVASFSGISLGEARKPLEVKWDRVFGGSENDSVQSIVALPDGGFALAGSTKSKGAGKSDAWVLRLDSMGRMLWDKTLGGPEYDSVTSIVALPDGGFVVAGSTSSKGAGKGDVWVLRLDGAGRMLWDKTFGGSENEVLNSIIALPDGGFALAGLTFSKDVSKGDAWVLRLDSTGRRLWNKTFGGPKFDNAKSIIALPDGGLVVAGWTSSKGAGLWDAWVLRLDSAGRMLWDKTFGGSENEVLNSIVALPDGGFAAAGSTESKGGGTVYVWVLRLDSTGQKLWDKTFGVSDGDSALSIVALPDGGFAVAGVTYENKGDALVVRLDSTGRRLWNKTFGGPKFDMAVSIIVLPDGGFALAGSTKSKGAGKSDAWVLRLGRTSAK